MTADKTSSDSKVVFADSWQVFFARHGIKSFDDFFDYSDGQKIGKNNKRNVCSITLGQGTNSKTFFMKRFENPHYKDMLTALFNFGSMASQAEVEWNNSNALLANGINTYKPVCFGEYKKWGMEKKSFFVTEKLTSTEFVDFVTNDWKHLQRAQQEKIIYDIAKWISRIHDCNIVLPDLCVWHIFIDEQSINDDCNLSVIDLHRMIQNTESKSKRIRDLGKFYWSMTEKYFDNDLKNLFLDCYMDNQCYTSKSTFAAKVKARADSIAKHRQPKPY